MGGKAFIVTQSIKKLSALLQEQVFLDDGYKRLSDNKIMSLEQAKNFDTHLPENRPLYDDIIYKVLNADKAIDVGLLEEKKYLNGNTRMVNSKALLQQKVIITFSRKMMEYQRAVRNRQIERAKHILDAKNVDDIKKGAHDVTRFIKRTSKGKQGEEAIDTYAIDQAVIDREQKYDGFYAVATNLDDNPKDILAINANRYKIEDCFRVMKTNFDARPVYHRNRNRIIAHFAICYTALLIYRLLENKLNQHGVHFTANEIIQTLRNMNVFNIQDAVYAATFTSSAVCTALNGLFDLGLDKKYYPAKALNKKIRAISS